MSAKAAGKPLILLQRAERDIEQAIDHYRDEGGAPLAMRCARALEIALRRIGVHPAAGSPRYAQLIGIPGLRHGRARRFPYLIFYVERAEQVDIWRVLHAQRDMPAWVAEDP